MKSKTLRVSTVLSLGILFAGACGGTVHESSPQPAPKSTAPSRAASAPDESRENPADKTAVAQPTSEMSPSEKMPASASADTDTASAGGDNAETPALVSTALPTPTLENAGAERCTVGKPQVLGTSNAKLFNSSERFDITYGTNGGLSAWPDGDVVRTRVLSRTGEPAAVTHTVEMPINRTLSLFPIGDRYLLVARSLCRKSMIASPGALLPSAFHPLRDLEKAAKWGSSCAGMRILDKTGQAAGPVSSYYIEKNLESVSVNQIAPNRLMFCGTHSKSGPECAEVNIGPDNELTAVHVYSSALDKKRKRDMIWSHRAIANGARLLLWTEGEDTEGLVLLDDESAHHLGRTLPPSSCVNDIELTDSELLVVTGHQACLHQRGHLYNLSRLSLENGNRLADDIKMKRGRPIPAPFDQRVYFYNSSKSPQKDLWFFRHNIVYESVGEAVKIADSIPKGSHPRVAFNGRVFTLVYPTQTARKEWTLHLVNWDCAR